jgi:ankyrin repeat protein
MIGALNDGTRDGGQAMLSIAIFKRDLNLLRQALEQKPPVNSGRDQRQSPLGSAILNGGEVTDQIVRLLLDHGADPESPVQWETGYPSGSQPNSALIGLTANAQRVPRGRSEEGAARVVASQLRALENAH